MDEIKRRTRRAFLTLGGGALAAGTGAAWMWSTPEEHGLPSAVRRVLDFNGRLAGRAFFDNSHLAPQFPAASAQPLRPNGDIGLGDTQADAGWTVNFAGTPVPLTDLQSLGAIEQTTEFKCVEGWSSIARWRGVPFAQALRRFAPSAAGAAYAGLTTPDREYFVGIDLASLMHPQTLLAWELNGAPLDRQHGAPLRLVIPVKYGIKNIKRIAAVTFSNERPPDYWHQDGYDYFAGL